ncbi:SAM-dependent methyltransferase [Sphaerisporangium siamense]|uniref:Protein-L-isoaspartate O-methyltransferase n=1 Tax=Sphaerisporangium siamense TaxID=795645 RepID=A0A7W7D9M6_9ACTN|nr:ATP-grasp peptide maturase system methyltransferase [Sphaerisporangium siamense]MBB4701358.1 methyltransferase of ATP-grasp peptide maturase system [Sphaerisporangium siamense]GII85482.1 SAM-dependent methyltransferase [Sphaerisporangium siamense]
MTIPTESDALRSALAGLLGETGALTDPRWCQAIKVVPRELFLGEAVYQATEGDEKGTIWEPVRRSDMSNADWLRLAYADDTWVTQLDGVMAADARAPVHGDPTSSSSSPGLVVRMLEAAQIGDRDKVLEIGTGTGYSTALMCHRLGSEAVTSIECDPGVAAHARKAIEACDHSPTLIVGDGLNGYEKNAEYDRLIATCSVRFIPPAWMWQVRDGGTITTPMWGWMDGNALAHLTLADDGTASGRFHPYNVAFMNARPHGRPPRASYMLGIGDERESRIDPSTLDDWTGCFVAQLAAPSAEKLGAGDEMILLDVATGSQASTRKAGAAGWTVRQHGPLRLWDAVEDAIETWRRAGSPHQSAFGLSVSPSAQWIWLGAPDGPRWRLPV